MFLLQGLLCQAHRHPTSHLHRRHPLAALVHLQRWLRPNRQNFVFSSCQAPPPYLGPVKQVCTWGQVQNQNDNHTYLILCVCRLPGTFCRARVCVGFCWFQFGLGTGERDVSRILLSTTTIARPADKGCCLILGVNDRVPIAISSWRVLTPRVFICVEVWRKVPNPGPDGRTCLGYDLPDKGFLLGRGQSVQRLIEATNQLIQLWQGDVCKNGICC